MPRNERNLMRATKKRGNADNEFVLRQKIEALQDELTKVEALVKATVTFNSDGGSSVQSQSVPYNTAATEPADPTKSGYTFDYWMLNDVEFNFATKITTDITLKAHWTAAEE